MDSGISTSNQEHPGAKHGPNRKPHVTLWLITHMLHTESKAACVYASLTFPQVLADMHSLNELPLLY